MKAKGRRNSEDDRSERADRVSIEKKSSDIYGMTEVADGGVQQEETLDFGNPMMSSSSYRSLTRSVLADPQSSQDFGVPDMSRSTQEKTLMQQKIMLAPPEEKVGGGKVHVEVNSFEPKKRGSSPRETSVVRSMLTTRRTADSLGKEAYESAISSTEESWLKEQQEKKPADSWKQQKMPRTETRTFQEKKTKMLVLLEELCEAIRESTDFARKNLGLKSNSREILPSPDLIAGLMTKEFTPPMLPLHYNRACSFITKAPAAAVFFITMNWLQAAQEAGVDAIEASEHFNIEYDHKLRDFKVRGTVFINDSRAGWNIHIFQVGENSDLGRDYAHHRLVEIQRRDGDAFTFSTFYNKLACHLYHSSQMFQQKFAMQGNRTSEFYKMYSPWPEEGEFTIEEQFEPDWHGLPEMEQEYKDYGMLNLSRDPSCARIFIGMLKNEYAEIKSQGIASLAKAIRYPLNKQILMKPDLRGDIMRETIQLLETSRDALVVRCTLVIIREAFRVTISLWEAAQHGRPDIVSRLLSEKVCPDERDPFLFRTPLMYALEAGDLEIAEMLLEAGASLETRARDGTMARDYATGDGLQLIDKYSGQESSDQQEPPIAKSPKENSIFTPKQRLIILQKVVENVLASNRWANPKNGTRHPTSSCVVAEAVTALKVVIGIRQNFDEHIISVVNAPKLRDIVEQLRRLEAPVCEVACSYCSACQEAMAQRTEPMQPRVPTTEPCLLQPFQSSFTQLQQLVDVVLTAA